MTETPTLTLTLTPHQQIDAIERFLRYVFEPNDLIEIRGLGSPEFGVMRMLANDAPTAARAALKMTECGANVYFALNPIRPDSKYATSIKLNNLPRRARQTAKKESIASRNLYLLDIDPTEHDTAATPEELAAALALATTVREYLTSQGWPEPILLSSGNGVHMLYKGDRCSPEGDILALALKYLDLKFSTPVVKVDIGVFDEPRVARLPFTWNKKAGRLSSIISYPTIFNAVNAGKIYGLAVEGGLLTANRPTQRRFATCLDPDFRIEDLVDEFPDQFGEIDGITEEGDLTYYSTSSCPYKGAPHHDQGVGKGHSCLILGGPSGLGFKCLSGNCVATISDVLNKLFERTGRRYSREIWTTDLSEYAKVFPFDREDDGKPVWLDDATQLSRAAATTAEAEAEEAAAAADVETTEPEPMAITITALESIYMQTVLVADDLVGRVNHPAQRDFRTVAERIAATHNHKAMRCALGEDLLADIDEDVRMADAAPRYEDEDGVTTTYLTCGTKFFYLARQLKGIL